MSGSEARFSRGRVARPFSFALTDPGVRLSRTGLFSKINEGKNSPTQAPEENFLRATRHCVRTPAPFTRHPFESAPSLHRLVAFGGFKSVGSEEAPAVTRRLASVRRSNRTCRFPASGFHKDARKQEDSMEGIRPTKLMFGAWRGGASHRPISTLSIRE